MQSITPHLSHPSDALIEQTKTKLYRVLSEVGIRFYHDTACSIFVDHGCTVNQQRVKIPVALIEQALQSIPSSFIMYTVDGNPAYTVGDGSVRFAPGSSCISILDYPSELPRQAVTTDLIHFYKMVHQLPHLDATSTAMTSMDIPQDLSDVYRLYLALCYTQKPIVTGAFSIQGFEKMHQVLLTIRGSAKGLQTKPFTIFSVCALTPLSWSETTTQHLLECSQAGIPMEVISMPQPGHISPISLWDSVVQHGAENLAGIVLSQLINPGTPVLYGGSIASFDMKYMTTPVGSVEASLMVYLYAALAHALGIPSQAYQCISDAKALDSQAGAETFGTGLCAGLAGVDHVSGLGMLDFESAFSLEKLAVDHQWCGQIRRFMQGIQLPDASDSLELFQILIEQKNLLSHPSTLSQFRSEQSYPSEIINRKTREMHTQHGARTLFEQAHSEVEAYLRSYEPIPRLGWMNELETQMNRWALEAGLDHLPSEE